MHDSLQAEALGNPAGHHNTCLVAADPDTAAEGRSPGCMGPVARTVAACMAADPVVASSSRRIGSGPVADGEGRHRDVRVGGSAVHSLAAARPAACQKAGKTQKGQRVQTFLLDIV